MGNIFFILGQTATGKTARGFDLATRCGGVLINADRGQMYKGCGIVSGGYDYKNPEDIKLLQFLRPDQELSSAQFALLVRTEIQNILSCGQTPIIVGGSTLYTRLVLENIESKDTVTKKSAYIASDLKDAQAKLNELNPSLYNSLNNSELHNLARLNSRINKILYGGVELDIYSPLPANLFGANLHIQVLFKKDLAELSSQIKARVESRISDGAIGEYKALVSAGYTLTSPGLKSIGYTHIGAYTKGQITEEQLVDDWTLDEMKYAKRQKTYFKKFFEGAEFVEV